MDSTAATYGYDNVFTAVSYAGETSIAKYDIEGRSFKQWRSAVWDACYLMLSDWENGIISEPSTQDVINGLPTFVMLAS